MIETSRLVNLRSSMRRLAANLNQTRGVEMPTEMSKCIVGLFLSVSLISAKFMKAETPATTKTGSQHTAQVTLGTGPGTVPDVAIADTPGKRQAASVAQGGRQEVTLGELTHEALVKNPAVKSAWSRVQALRARVPQARSLPDPVASVGWMGNITPFSVQTGDPSSYRSISAMQELLFPGKLKLRGQIADREAQAAWWDFENARRQVVAGVKLAYYDYFYYSKATDITQKDKDLLEKLTKIAEARYKVGKGIQQDVLRAQVELSRLLQQLTVLDQQERTARVRLNTLLDRDPEAALPPAAAFEQAKLPYTLEELYQMARKNDPGLERQERMIERGELAVNLARKEYDPDFRVGYMYQQRPIMPDMHGFTVGINIPIFYKNKQREGVIEATEDLIGARRSQENRETTVNFEVKEQYLAAKASEDLARLYSNAVVPQSSLALESSMSAYEVGKVDFLTMLDNFLTVLDYEINYYRELSDYQMALARLEPLVGVELAK